jgi:excisionase family DNA binding protein
MSTDKNGARAAETPPRLAYSVDEFCAMTRVSRATVYRWAGAGLLSLAKCGGRRFITREAVDAWQARMAAADTQAAA